MVSLPLKTIVALSALAIFSACNGDDGQGDEAGPSTGISTLGDESNDETDQGEGNDDNASDDGPKLDMDNTDSHMEGGDCEGMGGMGNPGESFSYIWIANSPAGTVSKIATETGIEEARYIAGPGISDPSRTSVNLLGDAVVVDRNGGIAKIAVSEDRCVDINNNGVIDTSTGPANVLPWGTDECVLWHTPLPASGQYGPRPVAWEGTLDGNCAAPNPRVWVGYRDAVNGIFHRLNGETGAIEDSVTVPWNGTQWGPYGGAADQNGNFWVVGWSTGPLIKIDGNNLAPQVISIPAPGVGSMHTYGMALDADGNPWIVGSNTIHHYNVGTGQWINLNVPGGSMRGVMIDAEGRGWAANNGSSYLVEFDTVGKTLTNAALPVGQLSARRVAHAPTKGPRACSRPFVVGLAAIRC